MTPRIYFVGAGANGKSTLADLVAQRYHLGRVSSASRYLLNKLQLAETAVRRNGNHADRFHRLILGAQITVERLALQAHSGFVSERCIDGLVYAAFQTTVAHEIATSSVLATYLQELRQPNAHLFLVEPMRACLEAAQQENNASRTAWLHWDEINRWHGAAQMLLEFLGLPYRTVPPGTVYERTRVITDFLDPHFGRV